MYLRFLKTLNINVDFPDAVGPDIIAVQGDKNGIEVILVGFLYQQLGNWIKDMPQQIKLLGNMCQSEWESSTSTLGE